MLAMDGQEVIMLPALLIAAAAVAHAAVVPPRAPEVLFEFDSSALPANTDARLASTVAFAQAHPRARVVLDAYCDPIGTSPYNIGLAIRRATAVRDRLTVKGVPTRQIVLAIFGKDGARRATYAEDRRVSVWTTEVPLDHVITRTFRDQGTAVTWGEPLTQQQLAEAPSAVAMVEPRRGRH